MMALEHSTARAAAWTGWRAWSLDLLRFTLQLLLFWQDRWRQRQMLAEMDRRLLRDIGLSSSDAAEEARKPFWLP